MRLALIAFSILLLAIAAQPLPGSSGDSDKSRALPSDRPLYVLVDSPAVVEWVCYYNNWDEWVEVVVKRCAFDPCIVVAESNNYDGDSGEFKEPPCHVGSTKNPCTTDTWSVDGGYFPGCHETCCPAATNGADNDGTVDEDLTQVATFDKDNDFSFTTKAISLDCDQGTLIFVEISCSDGTALHTLSMWVECNCPEPGN